MTQTRRFELTAREAETRMKIQLGGLVILSGVADALGIPKGGDIEADYRELSAVIVGLLAEGLDKVQGDNKADEMKRLSVIGRAKFKRW